jgi:hypothetical protein
VAESLELSAHGGRSALRGRSAACPAANIHDFNHEKARPS